MATPYVNDIKYGDPCISETQDCKNGQRVLVYDFESICFYVAECNGNTLRNKP